jgi:hypothetical protein
MTIEPVQDGREPLASPPLERESPGHLNGDRGSGWLRGRDGAV